MIDFSKYTLQELQAISDALDTLTDDIVERDLSVGWVFREYRNARAAVEKKIAQHACDAAEDPPAGAPPAEYPDDLQALVDTLSRCSDQLAALALVEDRHFAESSQMEDFLRVSVLRNGNRVVMDLAAEIRDRYYDGLH